MDAAHPVADVTRPYDPAAFWSYGNPDLQHAHERCLARAARQPTPGRRDRLQVRLELGPDGTEHA